MPPENLFTMLSSYRPGTPATPFAIYCTQGLAYILGRGHSGLGALIAGRAGLKPAAIQSVAVQAPVAAGRFADLLVTFQGGQRLLAEIQIDLGSGAAGSERADHKPGTAVGGAPLLPLALPGDRRFRTTLFLSWDEVATVLADDPDRLTREFAEFIRKDVLGLGEVPLEQAITTNRLYALGAAALRLRFREQLRYQSSASPPLRGRYRYLGTMFALEGGNMDYWVGLVNEGVPLSEHYHLMLASKQEPLRQPVDQPRATGDWKWAHWTGLGRVVRPLTLAAYEELLVRLSA